MVIDFSAIDDNKSAFRSSYFIHSNKRDLSFTPGLKSSLLKPSLLVNGSMPILKFVLRIASDHNTAGFKDTWHSLTSCHFPLADGIYVCLLMRFQLALPQVSQDHVLRETLACKNRTELQNLQHKHKLKTESQSPQH